MKRTLATLLILTLTGCATKNATVNPPKSGTGEPTAEIIAFGVAAIGLTTACALENCSPAMLSLASQGLSLADADAAVFQNASSTGVTAGQLTSMIAGLQAYLTQLNAAVGTSGSVQIAITALLQAITLVVNALTPQPASLSPAARSPEVSSSAYMTVHTVVPTARDKAALAEMRAKIKAARK